MKKKLLIIFLLILSFVLGKISAPNDDDMLAPINEQEVNYLKIEENNEGVAVSVVRELPEVKKWLSLFTNNKSALGGTPIIEVDHMKDQLYVVHVYELINDLRSSHTATLNWYEVNAETKKAKPQF